MAQEVNILGWRATLPEKGEAYTFSRTIGYKMVQNRPFACRNGCVCGECNGQKVTYNGIVKDIIFWADNSIDIVVECDDGQTRNVSAMSPHGDLC